VIITPPSIFSRCLQRTPTAWHLPQAGSTAWMCIAQVGGESEASQKPSAEAPAPAPAEEAAPTGEGAVGGGGAHESAPVAAVAEGEGTGGEGQRSFAEQGSGADEGT
jgi:hypothetical protein